MTRRDDQQRAEGFALAAAAHDDGVAERARAGMTDALERQLRGVAVELSKADRSARRAFVRELIGRRDAPASEQGTRPARALALLATSVERGLGRAWLQAAPPPRPGYVPDPRLLALLRRLVVEPAHASPEEPR